MKKMEIHSKLQATMLTKKRQQKGFSLLGVIFWIIIGGGLVLLGMQVIPTYTEYNAVQRAVNFAKQNGNSVLEIRSIFDKQATVSYIESISAKDLDIQKKPDNTYDISFAYQKKINLFGPVSLVIDYAGSTASNAGKGLTPGV